MSAAVTRFAPSPTGALHIGGARTALFNLLFARSSGGRFILRMDDTDTARSSREHERSIMEDLLTLGIRWDEGPIRQSERISIYIEQAAGLLDEGRAYRCYCTVERLEGLKKELLSRGMAPRYDGRCRDMEERPPGAAHAVRLKVRAGLVGFPDGVHGEMTFDAGGISDFVIMGSDNVASYNFATAVDDALMGITDIVRGDDHISNTPRQLLVMEALSMRAPRYWHIPLVLGEDKTPLSKRERGASVRALIEEGYLPLAMVNAMARLGWNPGAERLMTMGELTEAFDASRLSKSASVFDAARLRGFGREALSSLAGAELARLMGLEGVDGAAACADELKANASTLNELKALLLPFVSEPEYSEKAREVLADPQSARIAAALSDELSRAPGNADEPFKKAMQAVKASTGASGKRLYLPVRAALTGSTEGIELDRILRLLGRERALRRLERFKGR